MKVLFLLLGIAVFLVLGFMMLVRLGMGTTKYSIAHYSEGGDHLTLEYHYTTGWGNPLAATILYFNGKMVDFRGRLRSHENDGSKVFPVRSADLQMLNPEIVDEKNAPVLGAVERIRRNAAYLIESAEFKTIQAQHPDIANWVTWTVWVNPNTFSKMEYHRIVELLRKGGSDLIAQQRNVKTNTSESRIKMYGERGEDIYAIWRTVYFDFGRLKNEVYVRNTAEFEQSVEVAPGGYANFRQNSDKDVAGYGCELGMLNDTGDTLVASQTWKYSSNTFPIVELSAFRDATGRALTDVYRIVEEPETLH